MGYVRSAYTLRIMKSIYLSSTYSDLKGSKEEFLREALEHASRQTVDMLSKPLASMRDTNRIRAAEVHMKPAHA